MVKPAELNVEDKRQDLKPQEKASAESSIYLGKLFSIAVRLHFSIVIIGALIVVSLARGLLPEWHPQWTPLSIWSTATVAGMLFFASLIAHEFSHALVAKRFGIGTEHITLFLFGAMAAIEREPQTPKQELLIAAAGPAMSLGLALLFSGVVLVSDPNFFSTDIGTLDLTESLSNLSYLGTVAFWLACINAMLGLFNLLPGFPMDGGRILRALIWWTSSDLAKATRVAARGGIAVGWLLILYGAVLVLNQQLMNGLWTAAIGYFISQLAGKSAEQFLRNRILLQTTVADIMRTRFERAAADLELDTFVEDYLLRSAQRVWPVTKNGVDVGYISLDDIPAAADRASQGYQRVADCMKALKSSDILKPTTSGVKALHLLADQRLPVPILDDGDTPTIVGLLHQNDVLRWIAQHPNLADTLDTPN